MGHGQIGLIPNVPRRLKSSKTLQYPDRLPAEQPSRAYVIIEPIPDDNRLGGGTARSVKSTIEDRRIGFSSPSSKEHRQVEMYGISPHFTSRSVELSDWLAITPILYEPESAQSTSSTP